MNKVILIGNLVRDPDFKVVGNDMSVCKFTIAVNRKFKKSEGENEADFFNIVTFRGLADTCDKWLEKGRKVGVSGSLQIRNYENNDGEKRIAVEVVADEVQFLSGGEKKSDETPKKTYPKDKPAQGSHGLKPIDDESVPF